MYPVNFSEEPKIVEDVGIVTSWRLTICFQPDIQLYRLLADLSPKRPWIVRKTSAQKLGDIQDFRALQGLLDRLPLDPFWMVRCSMIQALERIGDPRAIPTLKKIAKNDCFWIVQSYATKAIQSLSRMK